MQTERAILYMRMPELKKEVLIRLYQHGFIKILRQSAALLETPEPGISDPSLIP